MSTVASIASCPIGTVGTGERAITRRGASGDKPSRPTEPRISASVTMPSSSSPSETNRAETPSSPNRRAASRIEPSGWQKIAGRMIADTGVVPTSRSPWTVCPVRVRRFLMVWAIYAAPASVPSICRPASGSNTTQVDGSRARTVNAGAIPVSSEG